MKRFTLASLLLLSAVTTSAADAPRAFPSDQDIRTIPSIASTCSTRAMKTKLPFHTLVRSLEHRPWRSSVSPDSDTTPTACSSLIGALQLRPASASSWLPQSSRPTLPTLTARLLAMELPCVDRRLRPTPLLPKA